MQNTLVTISDNKIGVEDPNVTPDNLADYYEARVLSATDYYAFGMAIKERSWQSESYRYGFNGKENDTDWEVQDYGFRIYKPELAKFLSVDPLTQSYPWYTPYQFAGNTPIQAIDLDGAEEKYVVLSPWWTEKMLKVATDKEKTVEARSIMLMGMFKYALLDHFKFGTGNIAYAKKIGALDLSNDLSVVRFDGGDIKGGIEISGYKWVDPKNHSLGMESYDFPIWKIEPDKGIGRKIQEWFISQKGANPDGTMKPFQKGVIAGFTLLGAVLSGGIGASAIYTGEASGWLAWAGVALDGATAAGAVDDLSQSAISNYVMGKDVMNLTAEEKEWYAAGRSIVSILSLVKTPVDIKTNIANGAKGTAGLNTLAGANAGLTVAGESYSWWESTKTGAYNFFKSMWNKIIGKDNSNK